MAKKPQSAEGHLDKFLAEPDLWQRTSAYLGFFGIRLRLCG